MAWDGLEWPGIEWDGMDMGRGAASATGQVLGILLGAGRPVSFCACQKQWCEVVRSGAKWCKSGALRTLGLLGGKCTKKLANPGKAVVYRVALCALAVAV